jgi:peptide/nickel transport system permease protein
LSPRYLVVKLAQALFIVWGVSTVVFVAVRLSGDPVALLVSDTAGAEEVARLRRAYGFDRSLPVQYATFLGRVAHGDFGESIGFNLAALPVALARLPATLTLAVGALVVAVGIGVPAGLLAAVRRNSLWDRVAMGAALLGQSTPTFWSGLLAILVFAAWWRLLPAAGGESWRHLVLPACTLGWFSAAKVSRVLRSAVLEVTTADFVRTAHAKGLPGAAVFLRHVLPNALLSVVALLAIELQLLLGGAIVTETVFAYPGMGRLVIQAVGTRDYPLVQAIVLVFSVLLVLVNLIVELLYPWLDPRIARER